MAQLKKTRKAETPVLGLGKALPDEEVGYCRVSTPDQDPAFQIDLMRRRGIPEDNIFIDHGVSGRKMNRPQLDLALKLMRGRPGWTLVVYKLDRLGRDALGLMKLLNEDFRKEGWNLVSLTEQLDTRTPFGKFYLGLLAMLAQLESDMTAERSAAGMAYVKAQGGVIGRSSKLTRKQWAAVEKHLLAGKLTIPQIAEKFGLSKSGVNNHFPGWRGKTAAERKRHRAKHPLPLAI